MGTVYPKRGALYIGFKNAHGRWVYRKTPYKPGEEHKARAMVEEAERLVARQVATPGSARPGGPTVGDFIGVWLETQRKRSRAGDLYSAYTYESIAQHHLVPRFGHVPLKDVRPRDIRAWVEEMRDGGAAPKSIANRYGMLHKVFADAVMEELLPVSPCVLTRGALPTKRDKDPLWRSKAVFTPEEAWRLCTDPQLTEDRRVLYALVLLAGLRFGEASAMRWEYIDRRAKPLWRMLVAHSYSTRLNTEKPVKTEFPRVVPIHPALATILLRWEAAHPGHAPSDLLLRAPAIGHRRKGDDPHLTHRTAYHRWARDLRRLGMRHRRLHDARRTFISLCQADGADRGHLEWVTHGGPGDVMGDYTTLPWPTLCAAVSALKMPPSPTTAA